MRRNNRETILNTLQFLSYDEMERLWEYLGKWYPSLIGIVSVDRSRIKNDFMGYFWNIDEKIVLEAIDFCDRFISRECEVARRFPYDDGNAIMRLQENGRGEFQGANHRKAGSIIS